MGGLQPPRPCDGDGDDDAGHPHPDGDDEEGWMPVGIRFLPSGYRSTLIDRTRAGPPSSGVTGDV